MDAIDEKKIFKDQPENVTKFNMFIWSAFDLFVQEKFLNKEVINDVKNLNYMTADIKIFVANGRDVLQRLDIKSLLNLK